MKKKMVAVLMAALVAVSGTSAMAADFTPAADLEVPAGKTLRTLPVDQEAEDPIKIASICVQNNPWGAAVMVGQNYAKDVLADRNCTVDVISVENFEAMSWTSTIENCVASGYNAICIFGVSDELDPVVQSATDAGILVYCFNGDLPDTERTAWFGMDDYAAGQVAGEAIKEALADGGKYAIITGDFSVTGHEKRRTGARSVLDDVEGIELIGEYENNDDAQEAYTHTTNILTANPDLKALYVTAGGPSGAAQALEDAGKAGEVTLVCHDVLDAVADYIANGTISMAIDQDPFNQGYEPVVCAFNKLVADQDCDEINAYDAVIATPDTVKDLFPELFE
ncbi:MAG: substrate-binding domain-containing protein [Eubacteriales bacterium]|nr:substrate-binding domain-containing protein [Eubacteriales bacterium]